MDDLVVTRDEGLYCPAGDFYIDPWRPVHRAVITHAHSDHAAAGHAHYLVAQPGAALLAARLGELPLTALRYGERLTHNGVTISLHPAGHVLGSAQVRLEHRGAVWVVSGDYKLAADPTCAPFEPVACHTFITESTFGLPIYRWPETNEVYRDIHEWWQRNAAEGRTSVLFAYALGKAQRILAGLDPAHGPIICHGAVEALNQIYRECGVALPPTLRANDVSDRAELKQALVLAPPSARNSPWLKRFGDHSDGFASGWMVIRGARRRRSLDRGFVLSDHADWPGLLRAIGATGAQRVIVTHGQVGVMVRWLKEKGWAASAFRTEYGMEEEPGTEAAEAPGAADA